jgi:predicted amidophosphoribosyltransferase
MKWQDPQVVLCPVCSHSAEQSVSILLARSAICPSCGASLDFISDYMHRQRDEWQGFLISMSLALEIEDAVPQIKFADDDLIPIKSLADLVALVGRLTAGTSGPLDELELKEIVISAAKAVYPAIKHPEFDKSLLDVYGRRAPMQ